MHGPMNIKVTSWSLKIYYVVSSYLKVETMAENLFKIYLSVMKTAQSPFRVAYPL